jgi:NTP pyrophosphatase (non-canonical NTP hydrolase)
VEIDWNTLAKEVHSDAVDRGWWPTDQKKSMEEQVANFHAEVSEAWEEWRAGHALTEIYHRDSGKPEGIPIELADVVIRILDTAAAYGFRFNAAVGNLIANGQMKDAQWQDFATFITWLHRTIGKIRWVQEIHMAAAVVGIVMFCEKEGIDLENAIHLKMAFNLTRSHRHGNKKA